jgi:phenylacetate-CoA ligase
VAGTVWPPISLGGSAVLAALISQLEATERFPIDVIEQMQGRQLGLLATHHRAHTPSFAARLKDAGLAGHGFDSVAQLRRLPPIGRRDVQGAGEGFFSALVPEAHQPVNEVKTSGSTGEPVKVRKTQLSTLLWYAMTLRDLLWHGNDFSGRITTVRPQVTSYYERIGWGRPVDDLYVSGPAQGIPLGTDIKEQLRLMRQFNPDVLVVFPSNLKAMAEIWEVEGFEPRSLRRIRTLSETVNEELRSRISQVTGVHIEDHYSSLETGAIAVQCPQSDLYHVMAETVIVEVLDFRGEPCGEGENGRVVVTDLHNLASPLIRYEIGDYAEVGGACPCGRGLPTLRRILGRERNLVLLPDGRRHWPLLGQMSRAFGEASPIRQFQMVQHSRTAIELRAVADRPLTPAEQAVMIQVVQKSLDYTFDIEIVRFQGRLPIGANGKFEDFMCLVTADDPA